MFQAFLLCIPGSNCYKNHETKGNETNYHYKIRYCSFDHDPQFPSSCFFTLPIISNEYPLMSSPIT
jgi:hypothetical protein